MFIYLPEIKSKLGEAVDYSFQKALDEYYNDFSEGGTLDLMVSATYTEDKVLISGSFEASFFVPCSRCLEAFTQQLKGKFTEVFTVVRGSSEDYTQENLADQTANMLTVHGDYLYLEEYIRQQIILVQEFRPLCKEECKGICAGCGADLNQSSCQCSTDDELIDVRLLKLKEYSSGS